MDGFLDWWQHLPSQMSPIFLDLGIIQIHYYGLMYLLAFITTYMLGLYRIRREEQFDYSNEYIQNLLVTCMIGVLLGGRLGYVLFYNLPYYISHPLEIILPFRWEGGFQFTGFSGMSYHGGLAGVIIAVIYFARKQKSDIWQIADLFSPIVPLGYTFGRMGNFINGELWGRVTDASIGMFFPDAPTNELRHPSQLYEALFEGLFLFAVLWFFRNRSKPRGALLGWYLIGYGVVRFFIEFFREPDAHIGIDLLIFSRGQILCFLMILAGAAVIFYLKMVHEKEEREIQ